VKRNIAIVGFKNEARKELDKQRKDREIQNLKDVESQLGIGFPDGPKKDDDRENKNCGAQAPGMPTEKDGYCPPKNWDGKKVKHPKNGKYGWPDENGSIWVPSGPNGHGGPHWDVQSLNGKRYANVYPGGKIRAGRK